MKVVVKIFFLVIVMAFVSCQSRSEKIIGEWKWIEGNHMGDFLSFKLQNFSFKNDTLYKNNAPFAIVVDYKDAFYGAEDKLKIRPINSFNIGTYTKKSD